MEKKIGFIGLGNMGLNMAKNLIAAGYHLQVYNRTASKINGLDQASVTACKTPAEAAENVPIIITMLSEDEIVKETVTGAGGILKTLPKSAVHISMSTIGPDTSEELAKVHEAAGNHCIASPVFGRPDAAAAKKLWICTSGNKSAKEIARPVLDCLGQGVIDFGEKVGGANVVKIAGNFMIIASLEMMSKHLRLPKRAASTGHRLQTFSGRLFSTRPFIRTTES